jgi:rare lipoprotein A
MTKLIVFIIALLLTMCDSKGEEGIASWYGAENSKSCTGKKLHHNIPAAAHRSFPIGTKLKVTSIRTRKFVVVVVVDRGPYTKKRIIDLNKLAAKKLGMLKSGTAKVIIEKL